MKIQFLPIFTFSLRERAFSFLIKIIPQQAPLPYQYLFMCLPFYLKLKSCNKVTTTRIIVLIYWLTLAHLVQILK